MKTEPESESLSMRTHDLFRVHADKVLRHAIAVHSVSTDLVVVVSDLRCDAGIRFSIDRLHESLLREYPKEAVTELLRIKCRLLPCAIEIANMDRTMLISALENLIEQEVLKRNQVMDWLKTSSKLTPMILITEDRLLYAQYECAHCKHQTNITVAPTSRGN